MRIHWFFIIMVIFYSAFSNNLDATLKRLEDSTKLKLMLKKHKRSTYGIMLLFGLIVGCACFPFVNFTFETSVIVEWSTIIIFLIYCIYTGITEAVLFRRSQLATIIVLNSIITLLSMTIRYFLEFGKESSKYLFTFPNVALHIVTIVSITTFMWYMSVREIKHNVFE